MLHLLLFFSGAFWGDVQIKTWGSINVSYGVGLPISNRLELVEFAMGYSHIGIGAAIAESYGFAKGDQFIGSVIPLSLTVPLYQKIKFSKNEAYFKQEILFKLRVSPWGQRFTGSGVLDYIKEQNWEAKAPYVAFEVTARWVPVRVLGIEATLGSLFVGNAPDHFYLNLGISTGTAGPVEKDKIGPRLEVAGVVFDDSESGNSNGTLEPGEKGRILVLIVNRGLQDSGPITLNAILRDVKLTEYLSISNISIPGLEANNSTEAAIPVTAASKLPALPLRIRISGKDSSGNLVPPAYLEIPTSSP